MLVGGAPPAASLKVSSPNMLYAPTVARRQRFPTAPRTVKQVGPKQPPGIPMHRAIAIGFLTAACSYSLAGDWPTWRGPTGQGLCDETNLPLKWTASENVRWKIPLAHQG